MRRNWITLCLCVVLVSSFSAVARSCTTFCIRYEGEWVFGRNLDWMVEKGLVVVNKRNVAKEAFRDSNAVRWASKYGSVTFNMYGREIPMGGMNEAGLVIENMWLSETTYPAPDPRPEFAELQWVQYQLDTSATVDEVIASDSDVRISGQNGVPLHFLVCDRMGGCATIEFLDGKMVHHTGDRLPVTALANSIYDESVDYLSTYTGEDTSAAYHATANSLGRFCTAAERVKAYDPDKSGSPIDYAFATLDSVSNDATQWSIVYDPKHGHIYFRNRSNRNIRRLDFAEFDFSCGSQVKTLDMLAGTSGDASKAFVDYTYEQNYDLIRTSFSQTGFLRDTPDETLRQLAHYPETTMCVK